jgi:hypothetical protein
LGAHSAKYRARRFDCTVSEKHHDKSSLNKIARFERKFFDSEEVCTYIGSGSIGGKAQGLVFIKDSLATHLDHSEFPEIAVNIPTLTVIATDMFDAFMKRNDLYEIAYSDARDEYIANAFQKASLPAEIVGDLRALIAQVHTPLAIRSSSLLEDKIYEPFAGVYATKMIPNNQFDTDSRFRVLLEAIKFVYASTFFKEAKEYLKMTKQTLGDEKMAVIIQEVVGRRYGDRFYPHLAGVARSYNFYPTGHAQPKDGVVNLAIGLGKMIVDGGKSFTYSPAFPRANPPYKSIGDLLKQSQNEFWAVNMGRPPEHDPIKETEYMVRCSLEDSEKDGTLKFSASTYSPQDDRITIGIGGRGPRIASFAPILQYNQVPLNALLKNLLKLCENVMGREVEIEFAVTLDPENGLPARFGFLQMRPMFISDARIELADEEMSGPKVLAASEEVLGNGLINTIQDIVYLKNAKFDERESRVIASELEAINNKLVAENRRYLLVVYGRLGTTDPPFGIPVEWAQISGAKVIIEAALPEMNVELSQGSHFFHNVISFQVGYFSVRHSGRYPINWEWIKNQQAVAETQYVCHVRPAASLLIKIDGRNRRGVVLL